MSSESSLRIIYEKCLAVTDRKIYFRQIFLFVFTQMHTCKVSPPPPTLSTDMVHGVQEKLLRQQTIHIALWELPTMLE